MNSFFDPDEHFILMDINTIEEKLMTPDDLKAFRDAGIRTAEGFQLNWDWVEPEKGVYNWRYLDDYVERVLGCGMKAILKCYTFGPPWLPDAWCVKIASGIAHGCVSPFNEEAVGYALEFYKKVRDRYNQPGKVLVFNSWFSNGETMFSNEPAWFDDAAIASYQKMYGADARPEVGNPLSEAWLKKTLIDFMVAQTQILGENETKEVHTCLHPAIADFPGLYGNGNAWIEDLIAEYHRLGFVTHHLYYTWIQWGYLWGKMREWARKYNEQMWGGAEGAQNVMTTTPFAIENGLRGLYIGPLHPFYQYKHAEGWMLENIRKANDRWERSTPR